MIDLPAMPAPAVKTRGLSLFNPLNLMTNESITWLGEIKPTADRQGRLCQFDSFIHGIRAATMNLLDYQLRDGIDTIGDIYDAAGNRIKQGIIPRYAPDSENPTDAYVHFICDWCSVSPNDQVDLKHPPFLRKLVTGIIHFEQGVDFCTDYQISQGIVQAMAAAHLAV